MSKHSRKSFKYYKKYKSTYKIDLGLYYNYHLLYFNYLFITKVYYMTQCMMGSREFRK